MKNLIFILLIFLGIQETNSQKLDSTIFASSWIIENPPLHLSKFVYQNWEHTENHQYVFNNKSLYYANQKNLKLLKKNMCNWNCTLLEKGDTVQVLEIYKIKTSEELFVKFKATKKNILIEGEAPFTDFFISNNLPEIIFGKYWILRPFE